ncbi:MAG: hypothetical protein ACI32C_04525 [Candidatus Enteromonas sp.]
MMQLSRQFPSLDAEDGRELLPRFESPRSEVLEDVFPEFFEDMDPIADFIVPSFLAVAEIFGLRDRAPGFVSLDPGHLLLKRPLHEKVPSGSDFLQSKLLGTRQKEPFIYVFSL